MKKRQIFLILVLTVLLLNFSLAATQTLPKNTSTTNTLSSNPISSFMQKEISSEAFKIIGAPATIPFQTLLIYLLFILIAYIIITDLLNGVSLFDKSWYNYTIGLIVVLLGVYSGTAYKLILAFTKIQFTSIAATGVTYYIILGILGAYLLIRTFFKIVKRNKRTNEEKAEERADKIRLLRKAQDIEARAAGI